MAIIPIVENNYVGDGTTRIYDTTFVYLDRADVYATVDGESVAFTWLSDSSGQVELAVAPEVGAAVRLYRSTQAIEPRYAFTQGIPVLPRYIDENNRQLLYAVQESIATTADTAAEALDVAQDARDIAQKASDKVDAAVIDSALALRDDLANPTDPTKGAALVGFSGGTVADKLSISNIGSGALISGNASEVTVLRYAADSPIAPASYRKVSAEPSHALKFQAANGAWYEIAEQRITPRMAGAVYDGVIDDSPAILRAIAACVVTGADIDFESGTAKCLSSIALPLNRTVFAGSVTLDYSTTATARAVSATGRPWESLPALASSPARASRTLVFESAHGVSVNDVIAVRNPVDGSFNGVDPVVRSYYRAGEMCLVKEVVSATEVLLWEPLLSAYDHTVVTVHKLPGDTITFDVGRFTILAGPLVTTGIEFNRLRDATHDNITVLGSQRQAMYRTNCYNIRGSNLVCRQSILSGAGLDYGLVDGSCHKTYAQGEFFGQRHGYTGGNGSDLTLPCRFMRVDGIFANSSPTAQTLGAFNAHGNCEFYHVSGTFLNGGVQFGGDNGKASGRIYLAGAGKSAICGTECLGTNYDASGLEVVAPESQPDALIRFNTAAIGAFTVRGGKVNLKDVTVRAPLAPGLMTFAVASGRTSTDPILIDISGMAVFELGASATATISHSGSNPVERIISRDAKSYSTITWSTGSTTVVGTLP